MFSFFSFFVFLSLFSMFFFCLLLCQAFFREIAVFWKYFFSFLIFKESTLYLKKFEFTKKKLFLNLQKADVKISRISNSTCPPWNYVKFHSEFFFGKCLNKSLLSFYSFDCELIGSYKNTWFLR